MQFVARFTDYVPINAFLIYTAVTYRKVCCTRSRWWVRFGED